MENKKFELVSVNDEMPKEEGKYTVQTSASYSSLFRFPPVTNFIYTRMYITINKKTGVEERHFEANRQIAIAWMKEII